VALTPPAPLEVLAPACSIDPLPAAPPELSPDGDAGASPAPQAGKSNIAVTAD
jgi:hypothetical protein